MMRKDIHKCLFTVNFVNRLNWFPEVLLPIINSMENFISSSLNTDLNTMKQTPNWTKAVFPEWFFKWPVKQLFFPSSLRLCNIIRLSHTFDLSRWQGCCIPHWTLFLRWMCDFWIVGRKFVQGFHGSTAKETNTHSSAKMFSQLTSGEIWLRAEAANYLTFTWQEAIASQKPWNSKVR